MIARQIAAIPAAAPANRAVSRPRRRREVQLLDGSVDAGLLGCLVLLVTGGGSRSAGANVAQYAASINDIRHESGKSSQLFSVIVDPSSEFASDLPFSKPFCCKYCDLNLSRGEGGSE